jgi:hypothetical protein
MVSPRCRARICIVVSLIECRCQPA